MSNRDIHSGKCFCGAVEYASLLRRWNSTLALRIHDAKPKLADVPAAMGGSGQVPGE